MSAPVLDLVGVVKDYHALRPLRVARLTLKAAEQTAILGLDQPAAEVLVNLITGATLPDAGTVTVFGRSTASIDTSDEWLTVVDRIGIVSDRVVLLDALTVVQNLSLPFTLDIEPPPDDVAARASALASEVGLDQAAAHVPVARLNGAERARVRAGRALALDPGLLLLEHASGAVEREEVARFGRDLRAIATRRQAALLALTADAEFSAASASRVVAIDRATGRVSERPGGGWFGRWRSL